MFDLLDSQLTSYIISGNSIFISIDRWWRNVDINISFFRQTINFCYEFQ